MMPWARRTESDTPGYPRVVPTCRPVCKARVNRCSDKATAASKTVSESRVRTRSIDRFET